jgi:hypothetical protein
MQAQIISEVSGSSHESIVESLFELVIKCGAISLICTSLKYGHKDG